MNYFLAPHDNLTLEYIEQLTVNYFRNVNGLQGDLREGKGGRNDSVLIVYGGWNKSQYHHRTAITYVNIFVFDINIGSPAGGWITGNRGDIGQIADIDNP